MDELEEDAEIFPAGGFDVDDGDDSPVYDTDGDERSVASAPVAPDGETELNGWNELTWPGGLVYRGYWRENAMHGKGMLKSEAGIYSGDFIVHKICGAGRYDFNDGSIYIGEFVDNHFHGQVQQLRMAFFARLFRLPFRDVSILLLVSLVSPRLLVYRLRRG